MLISCFTIIKFCYLNLPKFFYAFLGSFLLSLALSPTPYLNLRLILTYIFILSSLFILYPVFYFSFFYIHLLPLKFIYLFSFFFNHFFPSSLIWLFFLFHLSLSSLLHLFSFKFFSQTSTHTILAFLLLISFPLYATKPSRISLLNLTI